MKFHFILVETVTAGNIGACARALKTMGFKHLRLVNPQCNHLNRNALWMAHGSEDVLQEARIYDSFDKAIEDLDFIIATTARTRNIAKQYYVPEHVIELIKTKKDIFKNIGVVFGRESSGLSNEEILKCDIISSIPMCTTFPTLNLSQAVMLYAYLFFNGLREFLSEQSQQYLHTNSENSIKALKQKINVLFDQLMVPSNHKARVWLFDKINFLDIKDINYVFDLCNFLEKFIHKK